MKKKLEVNLSFKNSSKETIIPAMEALKNSIGWKLIKQELEDNVEVMKNEILFGTSKWDTEELAVWRRSLRYIMQLVELPDEAIEKFSYETPKKQNIELDPYKDVDN